MAPPDLAPPAGSPAGYGKSCMNCSRAKCKCILRPEGAGCERCHRLGKECQPMTTSRKRTTKKSTSSRTAQLEEKLEDLVSILRATQQQPNQPMARPESVDTLSNTYTTSRLDSLATAATASSHQQQPRRDAFRDEAQMPTPYTPRLASGFYEPAPKEAERRLASFRSWLRNIPFMHIPEDMTAATLRQERPFLWMCINNITTLSVREQILLKDKVRAEVSQRIIVDFERSMDLLLGLLTCLAWITMNVGTHNKPFMSVYAQLAYTVVSDLGLTRTPGEERYVAKHFKAWAGRMPPSKPKTIEERRAVIALWFITSSYCCATGKMESVHWTSHMQENLEYLEQQREEPLDEVLTTLVRVQLVADETVKMLVGELSGNGHRAAAPSHIFKKGFLQRVQTLRENVQPRLGSHYILQSCLLGTEILIHSLGSSRQINPDLSRIEGMYSCLQTIKAWYDVFFSIPLIDLAGLPFHYFAQLGQVLSALYRLVTSDDPDWDRRIVYKTADLLLLLEQTIQRLMQISTVYPVEPDGEDGAYYEKIAKILRGVKIQWEPILNQQMGEMLTPNSQQPVACVPAAGANNPVEGMQLMTDPYAMDYNEMAWMSDVFGPWEL